MIAGGERGGWEGWGLGTGGRELKGEVGRWRE